ncbi:MAG: phosphohistidine phosphatase SixA [Candidatus Hermodarchaeota archaeon]
MKLYLAQHGEAKSKDEDPERPLTDHGIEDVRKIAKFIAKNKPAIREIRHSGKLRAKQTAEILADYLQPLTIVAVEGIAPLDDVEPVAEELANETKELMIVGHLPFLDRLTAKLLTGDSHASIVRFRQGGIVCLTVDDSNWKICWMITPELV